ncbi:MAG: FeoB-associated Cys-rich membrane protein [Acutalibacteraceae bacterium]
MLNLILNNLGTVIISLAVLAVLALIVFKLAKDRKKGKSNCGCNCRCCPSAGCCHKEK